MSDIVISAQNLTKVYKLYNSPADRLKEAFHPLRKSYHHAFHALNNVSFCVNKGETFGIIGHNGAGKSTLLKILSGVLTQTAGTVQIDGRVSALLELGAGFNPMMTGSQNIYFQGAILGLTRQQIEAKIDSVLTFADIGEYVHQPVKTYSSGMFVRLAFAVSTMIEPQILILDEALAVGDIFFQQKCFKRLESLQESGVAILLVSHAMGDILQHCQRALVLNRGEVFFCGDARETVRKFFMLQQGSPKLLEATDNIESSIEDLTQMRQVDHFWPERESFLDISKALVATDGLAVCTAVALCDESHVPCQSFIPGAYLYFYYEFEITVDIQVPVGGVIIYNNRNIVVHGRNTIECETVVPAFARKGTRIRFRQRMKADIGPGEYTFSIGIASLPREKYAKKNAVPHSELTQSCVRLCNVEAVGTFSISGFPAYFPSEKVHIGLCNLAGDAEIYLSEKPCER